MNFSSVCLSNFMSFKHGKFIFGSPGLTLIEGINLDDGGRSNAAGKSTPWDAISWCLFGQTIRGSKNDEIINRVVKKDCRVVVEVDNFVVTRYRQSTEKDSSGKIMGNRLMYCVDGKLIEKGSIDETQRSLLFDLGIDFDLFRCTVLFGQRDSFNFVESTDKQQKEILSKVRCVDYQAALKKTRARLQELISGVEDKKSKITLLKSHLEESPGKEFRELSRSWKEKKKERLDELKEDLIKIECKLSQFKDIDLQKNVVNLLQKDLFAFEEKIAADQKRIRDLRLKKDEIRSKIGYLRGKIDDANALSGKCPTCERPVDISFMKKRISEYEKELSPFKEMDERVKRAIDKLDIAIEENRSKSALAKEKIQDVKGREKERERIRADIEECKAEIDRVDSEKNPYIDQIKEAIERQEKIKEKISKIGNEIEVSEKEVPYVRFWETAFSDSGIKSYLFDSMCGILTERSNYYLDILTSGSVAVEFDTQTALKTGELREKFECQVITDGENVPFRTYSGGEKTSISLSVDMALADLMGDYHKSKFNIAVFDERDEYLDHKGRMCYLDLLKERAKNQRVFVIAHDADFKGMFDESWLITKEDRISVFSGDL